MAEVSGRGAILVGLSLIMVGGDNPPTVSGRVERVLVHLDDEVDPAAWGLFEVAPGIAAGRIPEDSLRALRRTHPQLRFEPSAQLRPSLNRARASTRVQALVDDTGATGSGTIIGVIDGGFDLAHPAFRNDDGSTRVAWLMTDEAPVGLHPALEEAYGCTGAGASPCAIYDASDIDARIAGGALPDVLTDPRGHGTHVASLAAGDGDPGDGRYRGVAPEAGLVLVIQSSAAYVDQVLNGARFVFDRAASMDRPAVVNLSSGYHGGPHDGSSALAVGLAAMVGPPGRAIVVAAGNDGLVGTDDLDRELGLHTEVELTPGIECPVPMVTRDEPPVDLWFSHGGPLEIGLRGPSGVTWLEPTGEDIERDVDGLTLTLDTARPAGEGRLHAWLHIEGSWALGQDIAVVLRGEGYVDAWAHSTFEFVSVPHVLFLQPTSDGTLTIPATHPELIAVGATVNRIDWPSPFGSPKPDEKQPGDVPAFSAFGPNGGGRIKPDLVAPGHNLVAALAAAADPTESTVSVFRRPLACDPIASSCAVVEESYAVLSGTSMASPIVAGTVALLLEARPQLTQAEVLAALTSSARRVGGDAHGAQIGAGELSATNAMAIVQGKPLGDTVDAETSRWTVGRSRWRRGADNPVRLQLRDASGRPVAASPAGLTAEGAEVVDASLSGPATVDFALRISGTEPTAEVRIRYAGLDLGAQRLPLGADGGSCGRLPSPPEAKGGCAVSRGGGEESGWLFLAVAFRFARRRSAQRRRLSFPACCR